MGRCNGQGIRGVHLGAPIELLGRAGVAGLALLLSGCASADDPPTPPAPPGEVETFQSTLRGQTVALVELDPRREECTRDPTTLDPGAQRAAFAACGALDASKLAAELTLTRDIARFSPEPTSNVVVVVAGPAADPALGGVSAWYGILPLGPSTPAASSSTPPSDSGLVTKNLRPAVAFALPFAVPAATALVQAGTALLGLTIGFFTGQALLSTNGTVASPPASNATIRGVEARVATGGNGGPDRELVQCRPVPPSTYYTTRVVLCTEPRRRCPDGFMEGHSGQGLPCPGR